MVDEFTITCAISAYHQ